jgi:hypothetical protein
LDGYLIRRAVECATITYDQLKTGTLLGGAPTVSGDFPRRLRGLH